MKALLRSLTIVVVAVLAVVAVGHERVSADDIEQRIARFWQRIDALQPTDYVSTADLGLWAQLDPRPRQR